MLRALGVTLAIATSMILAPSRAEGQTLCGPYAACAGGEHMIACPYGYGYTGCHGICAYCAYGPCHSTCNLTELPGISDDQADTYQRLLKLARTAPLKVLMASSDVESGFIFFNKSRDAVQVLACDGVSIAASIPISGDRERRMVLSRLSSAPTNTILAAVRAKETNARLGVMSASASAPMLTTDPAIPIAYRFF